jgi:hypothetical protein
MKRVEVTKLAEASAVVRLVGPAPGGPPSLPGDSKVPGTCHRAGSRRGAVAMLKRYEDRDILVDTGGIACKPIALDSRLLSEKPRLHMIDEVPVSTSVLIRHVV